MPHVAPIRPPMLRPGDIVGIVAPASNIDPKSLAAGCEHLGRLGYVPYYLDSIFERDLFFAGSVARRVAELEHMFANPEVRAIVCARGGYGSNHVLPHLNIKKLLANPKPFIGYSDITTLLTFFADNGLVAFHGPMVAKDFAHEDGIDLESWSTVLGSLSGYEKDFGRDEVEALIQGEAQGTLYGGCLSMLVASLGTPYEIDTRGTILFLEDVNAKPYQVDRMLMQLKLAGKFEEVRGVIFGEMLDCIQPSGQDYRLQEIILRILTEFQIPVAYGFPSGHVRRANHVLPFAVNGRLRVTEQVHLGFDAAVEERRAPDVAKEQAGR